MKAYKNLLVDSAILVVVIAINLLSHAINLRKWQICVQFERLVSHLIQLTVASAVLFMHGIIGATTVRPT